MGFLRREKDLHSNLLAKYSAVHGKRFRKHFPHCTRSMKAQLAKTAERKCYISVYGLNTFTVVRTNPMQTRMRNAKKEILSLYRGKSIKPSVRMKKFPCK